MKTLRHRQPEQDRIRGTQHRRPGFQALHHLGRSWVFEEHEPDPDTCRKGASDICPHAPQLTRGRIFGVLAGEQRNPNFAGVYEVGDPRVRRVLRAGDLRNGEQNCRDESGETRAGRSQRGKWSLASGL